MSKERLCSDARPHAVTCQRQRHMQRSVRRSRHDPCRPLARPGACAGDVDRYMVEFADITAVVCVVDSLRFEVVSEEFVACTWLAQLHAVQV